MPTRIKMLDYNDFVCSPETPADENWAEYIKMADRLVGEQRRVKAKLDQSPFSPELQQRKQKLDGYWAEYTALFRDKYTLARVEQNPMFLHASRFFDENYPIRIPFSVLSCSCDIPLYTIREFQTPEDLDRINNALAEKLPLRWWHDGPMDRPRYLYGRHAWEPKASEAGASETGLALLLCEILEKERQRLGVV